MRRSRKPHLRKNGGADSVQPAHADRTSPDHKKPYGLTMDRTCTTQAPDASALDITKHIDQSSALSQSPTPRSLSRRRHEGGRAIPKRRFQSPHSKMFRVFIVHSFSVGGCVFRGSPSRAYQKFQIFSFSAFQHFSIFPNAVPSLLFLICSIRLIRG